MSKIESYVNEVLYHIVADENMKERIKSDLTLQLNDISQSENIDVLLMRMGEPKDVAREFMDSIYDNKSEIIERLIKEHTKVTALMNDFFEYKSKTTLFGLPLVHIKTNRRGGRLCVSKGIISIGTVAFGVISIGAIPVGLVSIGGAALGLFSIGGLAIGLLMAMGGVSVGTLALGGFAIGLGAIGGLAVGNIAIGGYARGTVAIGDKAIGQFTMVTNHIGPENKDAVYSLIKSAFPNLPEWITNFFSSLNVNFTDSK